jgi:acyl carrier protein
MNLPTRDFDGEIRDLLRKILKISEPYPFVLDRSSLPLWDSLRHMEIIFALEDRYSVRFDESEFVGLDSPTAIAASLRKHLAA